MSLHADRGPAWMSDPPVRMLFDALANGGIAARFVGGCVRDWVLERPISDIDIAVDKPPGTVTKALEAADIKVVPTGIKHGTVTAIVKSRPFEITTLRRDVETDGRHAIVAFTDDWREDASRRDFTFNALYADRAGTIYDYFDGQTDLTAGRVRFIGDPEQRIAEDRLRVLRFFRFHARFGKPPFDGPSFDACRRNAATVSGLSGERVRKELLRTLDAAGGADAFDAMLEAGVLDHWLPEYAGSPRLRALAAREEKADALRRLAAILPVDADATAIGKRLKLSTQESVRLQLMLDPANAIDTANLRASLYRLGTKLFIDRVLLDAPGDWRAALALAGSWTPPELPIGGNDALALGLKPGPKVGALLEAVERWWIAGDFSAGRDACLAELKRLADAEA
jgi:poly(A) polymerase